MAELGLRGINRIPAANAYLREEFFADFNRRFSVEAREKETAYRDLPDELNRDLTFGIKEKRKIAPHQSFSYLGTTYVIKTDQDFRYRTVEICPSELGKLRFLIDGLEYQATAIENLEPKIFKAVA